MTATRINPQEWEETVNGWTVRHLMDGSGRVEIRKEFTQTSSAWNAWGSVYEALLISAGSYPFAFASNPALRVDLTSWAQALLCVEFGGLGTPKTNYPNVYAVRPLTAGANFSGSAILYATGVPA